MHWKQCVHWERNRRETFLSKTRPEHIDQSHYQAHREQCFTVLCRGFNHVQAAFSKALLCHTPPMWNSCISPDLPPVWYSRPPAAVAAPSSAPPNEVRPGQEAINTEESHVSVSAQSGGRRSQLQLSTPALPHLCTARPPSQSGPISDRKRMQGAWKEPRWKCTHLFRVYNSMAAWLSNHFLTLSTFQWPKVDKTVLE